MKSSRSATGRAPWPVATSARLTQEVIGTVESASTPSRSKSRAGVTGSRLRVALRGVVGLLVAARIAAHPLLRAVLADAGVLAHAGVGDAEVGVDLLELVGGDHV